MPRRVVFLDTESRQVRRRNFTKHSFRLGCASFHTLDRDARQYGDTLRYESDDPQALWGWISQRAHTSHRTIVFAHNMAFDVRLSSALIHLPSLGFECKGMALNSYGFWARWQRRKQTMWLCDSLSFLPLSLEKVADLVDEVKPPLPDDDDPQETWYRRCRSDVEATSKAMLRVLAYLSSEHMGDFRLTGAAQGSAAFRHRFLKPKTLLVHDDVEALAKEREAAHAGRCEVWQHGYKSGPLYEYDYEYAYARLAYDNEVPMRLISSHSPLTPTRLERVLNKYAVLADVTVTTDTECVPFRGDSHIVWPTGTFRTTLWDCELKLLEREGGSYEQHRLYFYQRGPLLREWAEWIMGELDDTTGRVDPVVRVMLKDWSRSLIGRFGLRYPILDEIAQLRSHDVCSYPVSDADDGTLSEYVQIGGQLFERMAAVESPQSTPMVMSYIMAAGRVRLWELMNHAGRKNVIYADTDGIIVSDPGAKSLDMAAAAGTVPGLRRKLAFRDGTFRAPRNIDLGDTRRVTGAPKRAERLAQGIYRGEVWESIGTALQRRHISDVFVHEQTFHISDNDPRRLHLDDGTTAPLEVRQDDHKSGEQST